MAAPYGPFVAIAYVAVMRTTTSLKCGCKKSILVDAPSNEALNAVDGHTWTTWRGPLVVMSKFPEEELDSKNYIDVVLNSLHDFIDFVFYYREGWGSASDGLASESHHGDVHHPRDHGKIAVVRVA